MLLAVHQRQVGPLVAHAVHEPMQRLVVDLLRVEGSAHRRAEVGEKRQLLDAGLELDEFLLQLEIRIDDLLGLEIEQTLGVAPLRRLAEREAQRDSREERQRRRRQERPARPGRDVEDTEEHGAGAPDQTRRPEEGASRRILPVDVPAAGIVAASRAGALANLGAWQAPVGREALELHLAPGAVPDRNGLAGLGRPAEAGPTATYPDDVELEEAPTLLAADDLRPLIGGARVADAHGVRAEIGALLARLPVHERLAVAPRPALLVGIVHELSAGPHQLAGHREGQPVVIRHEVVAGPSRDVADRRDALG